LRSHDPGVNAYVVKPVELHRSLDAVRDLGVSRGLLNEPPPHLYRPRP
jgi:hypothetical protein